MKKKLSSSKKILISSILVGVLIISAIISLVAVLAASTQNINSKVSVSYIVDGVGAKVSANYYIINPTSGRIAQTVAMTDSNSDKELEFKVDEAAGEKSLEQTGTTVSLSSTNSKIVYEYKFTNTTEAAFKLTLNDYPGMVDEQDTNNMKVSYKSTGVKINNFASEFTDIVPKGQLVLGKGDTVYYYISSEVIDLNSGAQYKGDIQWILTHVAEEELSTLTLNNGDSEAESLKYLADATVQLPHIKNFPSNGTKAFAGYKNESGTKMYDANGSSLASEASASGVTYTAEWMDAYIVSDTGELTGLTEEAKNLSTLNIPDSVSTINAGVFNNTNTSAKTINIPSSVTTIGESAFEGNTVVEEIVIAEAGETQSYADTHVLTTVGLKAFSGCSSLRTLIFPKNVTTLPASILMGCTNLRKLEIYVTSIPSSTASIAPGNLGNLFVDSSFDEYVNSFQDYDDVFGDYCVFGIPKNLEEVVVGSVISTSRLLACSKINKITITDGATIIGADALVYTSISEIIIPESVVEIEFGSAGIGNRCPFEGCKNLKRVVFLGSMYWRSNGTLVNVTSPERNAANMSNNTTSEYFTAEWGGNFGTSMVKYEGDFDSNSTITRDYVQLMWINSSVITIPSNITSIENGAFEVCTSLERLELSANLIPNGWWVESVGGGSTGFAALFSMASNTPYGDYYDDTLVPLTLTEVVLTGGDSIASYAFSNLTKITKISISEGITTIGTGAFEGCSGLTAINYSGTTSQWNAISGLTSAGIKSGVVVYCTDGDIRI